MVHSLSRYFLGAKTRSGFILGFAAADLDSLELTVRALDKEIGQASTSCGRIRQITRPGCQRTFCEYKARSQDGERQVAMKIFDFETLDVFTNQPYGGNPLAVFTDAAGLSDEEMQALAAEMNYSETTFVLPPDDPQHDAKVRIFHRTAEMPFAGHPNVGTAFVLGQHLGEGRNSLMFEEKAGLVEARLLRDSAGNATGAEIDAPQPLTCFGEMDVADVAACAGLRQEDVITSTHQPTIAGVGVDFVLAEVSKEALPQASPNRAAFERVAGQHPGPQLGRLSMFLYCRAAHAPLHARMFAPLAGTWEDPATGSANAALAALLLDLSGKDSLSYDAVQGVEMGRPSRLSLKAWRTDAGIWSSVGGFCTPMFNGAFPTHRD